MIVAAAHPKSYCGIVGKPRTIASSPTRPAGRFLPYYRVSTDRRGRSGLGREGQERPSGTTSTAGLRIVGEFTDVGKLEKALRLDNHTLSRRKF